LSEGAAHQSAPESKDPALPHIADEIALSLETIGAGEIPARPWSSRRSGRRRPL